MAEPNPDTEHKRALAAALPKSPSMADSARRDAVIAQLPAAIRHSIPRHTANAFDVMNIVDAVLNYADGPAALLETLRSFEGDSLPLREVDQVVAESTRAALPMERPEPAPRPPALPSEPPPTEWDVFISHAREDKEAIARPLAEALRAKGLHVWYDEYTLSLGDRLRRSIDQGLARCRYGIVILSPHFFAKEWPQKELDGLVQRENRGEKVILPVWHNMDAEQIRRYSLQLADRIGVQSDAGLERVVAEVLRVAGRSNKEPAEGKEVVGDKETELPWDGSGTASIVPASIIGDVWVLDAPLSMEFVRIPAGEFLMGSDPQVDQDAYDFEMPLHRVYLPEYYIGRYPVTVEQYAAFAPATEIEMRRSQERERANHPVTRVSWHAALAFCRWLSERSAQRIRLPSEAEWEKAARGTDGRLYPWGNRPPNAQLCNHDTFVIDTTEVACYPAGTSPFGVLDMAGNVWEWTNTVWGASGDSPTYKYPYNALDGREDFSAPGARVLRGGAFLSDARGVRCACRSGNYPDFRFWNIGFRVVASHSHT